MRNFWEIVCKVISTIICIPVSIVGAILCCIFYGVIAVLGIPIMICYLPYLAFCGIWEIDTNE